MASFPFQGIFLNKGINTANALMFLIMGIMHRRPRPGDRVQFPHSRRMGYVGLGARNSILLGSGPGHKGHGVTGACYRLDKRTNTWVPIAQK